MFEKERLVVMNKKKNVLIFSREYPPNIIGGTSIVACSTAEGLAKLNYNVTVVSSHVGAETQYMEIKGVNVIFIATNSIYMDHSNFETQILRNHKHVVDVVLNSLQEKPDVVIVPDLFSFPEAIIVAKKYKVKLVNILLQDFSMMTIYDKLGSHKVTNKANANETDLLRIEKRAVLTSDINVFISYALAESIIKRYSLDKSKCKVIYLGVDSKEVFLDEKEMMLNIDQKDRQSKKIFCSIGRMVPIKGFDALIRAFKVVNDKYENTILHLLGTGPEVPFLEDLVNELCLKDKVKIFYESDRKKTIMYMNECDYAVVPSLWESFCYVAAEFMALGKPLIVNGVDSLNELMIDNETGFIVPVNECDGVRSVNIDLLAVKMIQLIEDDNNAKRFAMNAKERVKKLFINEKYSANIDVLIKSILE